MAWAVLLLAFCPGLLWAEEAANPDFAILIVGDEGDAEMLRREKILIQEMARTFRRQTKVPIYSYHFNKERERAYCEKKLNILKEDLLFVGVVSLKDRVPRKVVYRLDRIVSPARAAADVVARSDELAEPGSADATPSPEPSPSATPSTTSSVTSGWRVQLGVFTQQRGAQDLVDRLKAKRYDVRMETLSADGSTQYKVYVGPFPSKEEATQADTSLKNDGFKDGFVVDVAPK